jgi:hypothetical protein
LQSPGSSVFDSNLGSRFLSSADGDRRAAGKNRLRSNPELSLAGAADNYNEPPKASGGCFVLAEQQARQNYQPGTSHYEGSDHQR